MITYGMGEKATIELARRLSDGVPIGEIVDIPQTVFIKPADQIPGGISEDDIVLHSHEDCLRDKRAQAENFRHIEEQSNMMHAKRLIQKTLTQPLPIGRGANTHKKEFLRRKYLLPSLIGRGWGRVCSSSSTHPTLR